MAVSWMLKEERLSPHQAASHLHLDFPKENHNGNLQNALPRPAYKFSTAAQTKALQLLAAFAAVSVVAFFAYICSSYIRRRIPALSIKRKLAAGEDSEESDDAESCAPDAGKGPSASRYPHLQLPPTSNMFPSVRPGHAVSGASPSLDIAAAVPSGEPSRATSPQLGKYRKRRRTERKEREEAPGDEETKRSRLEALLATTDETLPPLPPLDPEIDALISAVLPGIEDALTADAWMFDDDDEFEFQLPKLPSDDETTAEESAGQQMLPPQTQTGPMPPGLSGGPSGIDASGSTAATPFNFFESVLSEGGPSGGDATVDAWLGSEEAEDLGEALDVVAGSWKPSTPPSTSEPSGAEPAETGKGEGPSDAATSEGSSGSEAIPSSETPRSDHSEQAVQRSDEVSSQPTAADPATAATQETAEGAPRPSILRDLLLSTPSSADYRPTIPAGRLLDPRTLQLRVEKAMQDIHTRLRWLKGLFKLFPYKALRTHPFYRHPGLQLRFSKRVFNEYIADSFRTRSQDVPLLLADCLNLLTLPYLSTDEFDLLLGYTERLAGYAAGMMPVSCTGRSAVGVFGRIFIVVDTLFCSAEVLGQSAMKNVWWPKVLRHIEGAWDGQMQTTGAIPVPDWKARVLNALFVALDHYRVGQRPPLHLVIGLKFALFVSPVSTGFQNPKWDPWRKAAAEWLVSMKEESQASGQSSQESTGGQ